MDGILAVTCIDGTDEKGRNTLKRIVILRDDSPYTVREISVTGLRQGHLSEIVFDDCRVPAANILSSGGDKAEREATDARLSVQEDAEATRQRAVEEAEVTRSEAEEHAAALSAELEQKSAELTRGAEELARRPSAGRR